MYEHCVAHVSAREESYAVLSHWIFGMNEMEGGDLVCITRRDLTPMKKMCWVIISHHGKFFKLFSVPQINIDDENTNEEDVLGYYKSWNHIIGGGLTKY
ncbi:unnamed protein product [Lactuca saligna]|uniref:Uncharacterized protein n=1 Tax=Lactuca saligna TaxID=75948 RepID=A0AA36ENR6_LACSI|nr:unnamed protein product [Lactuca saligna]